MTKKWIIYLILFLLTANIALVASLLVKTSRASEKRIILKHKMNTEKFERRKHHFGDHIAAELQFTDDQKKRLISFSEIFREDRIQQRKEQRALKQAYFEILSENESDTEKLDSIANRIGQLEVEKTKLEYNHYHSIRSICSPEQAEKFDSLSKNQLSKHLINDGHGHKRRQKSSCAKHNN